MLETEPELPEPSPELILLFALIHSLARSLSRKERAQFVLDMSEVLGMQGRELNVLPMRARVKDERVREAARQARAWWQRSRVHALRLMD